jgi:hypothetical protein
MIGLIISFILALQYAGQTHSWKSSQVIGLLVGFVLLTIVFTLWEVFQKERAMIVPRLVRPFHPPTLCFRANQNHTVPRTLCLGRFSLHVLLRRRLLCRSILPPHILPKHPLSQPHQLWRQNARFDHPFNPLGYPPRLCALKNRHRTSLLDLRRYYCDNWCRTFLYDGCKHFYREMDWLSNPRRLCHWSYIPSRYCECTSTC